VEEEIFVVGLGWCRHGDVAVWLAGIGTIVDFVVSEAVLADSMLGIGGFG
jgi:hypothetical protein